MSVLLSGPGGRVIMAAPGRPLLLQPMSAQVQPTPSPAPVASLAAIAGLTGWWDASGPSGMTSRAGTPLGAFGTDVGGVVDKSSLGAPLTPFHASSTSRAPVATARLNGLLGGLGLSTVSPPTVPAVGQQLPLMDPDQGLISTPRSLGSANAWTVMLVWSRPNWRQASSAPSTLLSIAGSAVVAADNSAGTNRLVLFPGAQQTVLTTGLTRRHTHALLLRHTPGVGVDAWLNGDRVATHAPNPLASVLSAPLLFLHGGTANGGAECWFHEAAFWTTALSDTDVQAALSYQGRWVRGPRKAVQILVTGQSNAGNGLNDGAWHLLAQGVAWHLGALAFGVVGAYGSPPAATCIHGEGIYPVPALGLTGSFLANPGDGSDPSTWSLGTDGSAVQNWLQSHTDAADAAEIAVILWPWSEDDSTRQYSEKSTFKAAARRLLALERAMLSRAASSLPQVWWSAIPFAYGGNDGGTQMHREVAAEIASDPSQNVTIVLPQTADSLPRSVGGPALAYDSATGIWSGGDSLHRDTADNQRFGMLAAPLVARAILASGGGDIIATLPATIPANGGPTITRVYRQSATTLVITVQHDAGNDLIVPATQAASGIGWAVMDGGSVASPASIVTATSCVRLNARQLQLTLSRPLVNASTACRLFYPYGTTTIGRGNVVTDNLSVITPPAGWDIAADLGSSWRLNMPLHAPMTSPSGVALSDMP